MERDQAVLWHPYTSAPAPLPPVPVVDAEGTRLRLADGRELIDGMSSWWCAIHGYRRPELDEAVRSQLDGMAHVMFGGLTHRPAVELAEKLVELTPPGLDRVFLCDSGSVAVEVALKMAVQYWQGRGRPERHRMVALRSGYHGDTLGAMALCDPVTGMHHLFAGLLPRQLFLPSPRSPFGAPVDPADAGDLRALLDDHADEVAAVFVEPVVQGAGGMRFYSADYLRLLRRVCDDHQILLVADEIATGFGRTGALFGCEHAGISPDIMCVGKALTGGYLSLAATLCAGEVAEAVGRSEGGALMHGPTFMGNPLACSVALASIRLLLSGPWRARVATIEEGLRRGLEPAAGLSSVEDVRVLGAIGVIETRHPLDPAGLQEVFLEHGVWLRPFGRLVYTMPPFVTPDEEVERITGAMVAAVGEVGAGPGQ